MLTPLTFRCEAVSIGITYWPLVLAIGVATKAPQAAERMLVLTPLRSL